MLSYLTSSGRDHIFVASLVRLMTAVDDQRIPLVLSTLLGDRSPLVRAAAVECLSFRPIPEWLGMLLWATADDYRNVRLRAAPGLLALPEAQIPEMSRAKVENLRKEYLGFIMARPDQWTAHYNLGNYFLNRGETSAAIDSSRVALEREPQAVVALVNLAMAHARNKEIDKAEKALQEALIIVPDSASAHFNGACCRAQKRTAVRRKRTLRQRLQADPEMAPAAYISVSSWRRIVRRRR